MKNFHTWLEGRGDLLKLYDLLLNFNKSGPWKNKNYHYSLVNALNSAGYSDDAKEISQLEPTEEEMVYANGSYIGSNPNSKVGQVFSLKRSHYYHKVEELLDRLDQIKGLH